MPSKFTKGKRDIAAKHYVRRSPFQQQFLARVDETEIAHLAHSARRALWEAFEAGVMWQKRHINNVKGEGNELERQAGRGAGVRNGGSGVGDEGGAVGTNSRSAD